MSRAFRKVIGWSECRPYTPPAAPTEKVWYWHRGRRRSLYWPHQGAREKARAARQTKQVALRRDIRAKIAAMLPVTTESLLDANMKPPKPPAHYKFWPASSVWSR